MTTEPEAIPADVLELAQWTAIRMIGDVWCKADVETIAEAIIADRASRAPVDGAEAKPVAWATDFFETLKDGTLSRVIVPAENVKGPSTDWTPLYTHPAPASPSGGEVRKLEWISVSRRWWWSETSIGNYEIIAFEADGLNTRLSVPVDNYPKWFTSLDEAKTAAQADYAQRIRSALTSPEAPQASEVVREAVEFLGWVAKSYEAHAKCTDDPEELDAYHGSAEMARQHAAALAKIGGDHDK